MKYQVICLDKRDYIIEYQNFDDIGILKNYIGSMLAVNKKVHKIEIKKPRNYESQSSNKTS